MIGAHPVRPRSPIVRAGLLCCGGLMILVSPIVGAIPGPGGVFVFAGGLALMLQNSQAVKRQFVLLKRRWPKLGHFADLGLRRASTMRRRERDRVPRDAKGDRSRWQLFWLTARDSLRGRSD